MNTIKLPHSGFRNLCTVLTILALCMSPSGALAKKKGKDKEKKREVANIVKTKTDHTFIVNGKTYVVSDNIQITVDNKKATFEQVKVGMKVTVTSRLLTSAHVCSRLLTSAHVRKRR